MEENPYKSPESQETAKPHKRNDWLLDSLVAVFLVALFGAMPMVFGTGGVGDWFLMFILIAPPTVAVVIIRDFLFP
ncbi:MAG: hypothetical protein K8T91_00975 [Planctomycetes bacterium]|nr:hypothetical protein [Planctomycetota bacterium]